MDISEGIIHHSDNDYITNIKHLDRKNFPFKKINDYQKNSINYGYNDKLSQIYIKNFNFFIKHKYILPGNYNIKQTMSKSSLNTDHSIKDTIDYIHGSPLNVKYDFPPLYPLLNSYILRERTFDIFIMCLKHLSTKLATAGFWYKGERDVVYCYLCGIGLCDLPINMTKNMINIAHIFKNVNCPLVSNISRTTTFVEDFIKYEIEKNQHMYSVYLNAINVRYCSEYEIYTELKEEIERQNRSSDTAYRVPLTLSEDEALLDTDITKNTTDVDTEMTTVQISSSPSSQLQITSLASSQLNSSDHTKFTVDGIYGSQATDSSQRTDTEHHGLCLRHIALLKKNNICMLCTTFKKIKASNTYIKRLNEKYQYSLKNLENSENTLKEFRQSSLSCNICFKNPCNVVFLPCTHICCCKTCHLAIPYITSDKTKKIKSYLPNCPVCSRAIEAFVDVSRKSP